MRKTGQGRIVMVSSRLHSMVENLDLNNLNSEKSWEPMWVYFRTKIANILFAKELQRRLTVAGLDHIITVNSLHPGFVRTAITRHADEWYSKIMVPVVMFFAKVCFGIQRL